MEGVAMDIDVREPEAPDDEIRGSKSAVSTSGSAEVADVKDRFAADVRRHFENLTSRGLPPNDAAALAMKLASHVAEPPIDDDHLISLIEAAQRTGAWDAPAKLVSSSFSSLDSLNASFLQCDDPEKIVKKIGRASSRRGFKSLLVKSGIIGVDHAALQRVYRAIAASNHEDLVKALVQAEEHLLDEVLGLRGGSAWPVSSASIVRPIIVCMMNPQFMEPEHHSVLRKLWRLMLALPLQTQEELKVALGTCGKEEMEHLVSVVQQFITIHLYEAQQIDEAIEAATKALGVLYSANEVSRAVEVSTFYNDAVNNEDFNVKEDYRRWKSPERYEFTFCKYPFIYDPSSKARILQLDSTQQMSHEFEDAVLRSIFVGATCPYLVLRVRRDRLIQDTIAQIQRRPEDLKKPLKVHFQGEEGVDEGGVAKEFFQLVVRELFDPKYGMFTYNEETRLFWFSDSALTQEMDMEYELIGVVVGLAIYNAHILEFRFPNVIYKKLMEQQPDLDDLAEVDPLLAKGLIDFLEFEGDVKNTFCRTFQVTVQDVFGEMRTVDLKPNGGEIAVTEENREEYVELYVKNYLETSIEKAFNAFAKGFHRLCGGPALQLFRPEELEQLVCGSPILDFEALEKGTVYDDGLTKDSAVIRHFWEVAHSLSEEDKKKLLSFATGSDRVPIKGLSNLQFVISRNGPDSDRLPTAHTCFNHLLLPEYKDKEKLRERLMTAIQNAEGFGLM